MAESSNGNGNGNGIGRGKSPGCVATQFKNGNKAAVGKGQSKGKGIRQMLERIGKESSKKGGDLTKLEYVCRKVWDEAAKGERWAIEILYDRMEGKPRQVIEMTNEDEDIGGLSDEQLTHYFDHASRN